MTATELGQLQLAMSCLGRGEIDFIPCVDADSFGMNHSSALHICHMLAPEYDAKLPNDCTCVKIG
jgi:hypothetical protein